MDVPPQSDLDAYDRVIAYAARRLGYGRIVHHVSGGLVKDYHEEARAHLGPTEKPSQALMRLTSGSSL